MQRFRKKKQYHYINLFIFLYRVLKILESRMSESEHLCILLQSNDGKNPLYEKEKTSLIVTKTSYSILIKVTYVMKHKTVESCIFHPLERAIYPHASVTLNTSKLFSLVPFSLKINISHLWS